MARREKAGAASGSVTGASFAADPAAVYDFVGAFFDSLRSAGVAHVVLSPGSRSTPLTIAADRAQGLRTWIELDERAAAFFALGLARATGRAAALVCTSGTAAANYLPAIVEAHYSRVPLLVLTADRPPELRDWGAGQTIDQPGLYGAYARWTVELPLPSAGEAARRYATRLAARAVDVATGSPAGAVHLNWPLREPLAPPVEAASIEAGPAEGPPVEPAVIPPAAVRFSHSRRVADPADVDELVGLVREHERGVICCGPMDPDPALARAVGDFARAAGWPVLADPASQLRAGEIVETAPILEMGDVLTRAPNFSAACRPSVVIRLGDTPVSKAQRLWIEAAEPESIWWLDEGGHWGEPSHRVTRVVRGGAASLLAGASQALGNFPGRSRAWCQGFEAANAVAREVVADRSALGESWSGLSVAATVARCAPEGGLLFASNSMSIRWLDVALANRGGALRVLCSRGASGIDGITSTTLGCAAGADRPTILLTGDLAFLHDLSGLLITRRESIPLTIVVVDDNGGGIFSFLPVADQAEAVGFERLFHTPHDVQLEGVAQLFELGYHAVDSVETLEAALRQTTARDGVSIVHARVEAVENTRRFRDVLGQACQAVDKRHAS